MKLGFWIPALVISASLTPPLKAAKVEAFTGKNADFLRYKSYQWLPPRVMTKVGIDEDNPANSLLREVLGKQLAQKGLSEVADGADLQIQVWVLTEKVPQLEAIVVAAVSIDLGTGAVTTSDPFSAVGRYNRQGALYLNLIDTRTKKSVWLAMVSDSLPDRTLKPKEIRAKLEKASAEIFKKYPVRK